MSVPRPSSEQAADTADNFIETQVISSKDPPAPAEDISIPAPHLKSWPSHASDIEEELEKTVHIHPGAQTHSEVNENPIKTQQDVPTSIDQQPDEDDDFLTETVVLRPPRKEG